MGRKRFWLGFVFSFSLVFLCSPAVSTVGVFCLMGLYVFVYVLKSVQGFGWDCLLGELIDGGISRWGVGEINRACG